MIRTYSSEGIVLLRKNYSEADRIVTIFTKNYGKVTALAKGVKKLKSKKRGHLEMFSNIKFIASKTKSIDIITEVETINDFNKIRTNLNKITLAYYFCEVVEKITREGEQIGSIYEILIDFFKKLELRSDLKKLRLEFLNYILIELGYIVGNENKSSLDSILDDVLERNINSVRVGKKVLTK